jgi:hypothetical protein
MDKKCTPTHINYDDKTALFSGSGKNPYTTTTESCTCRDFFVRRLPCKHIYRLRYELGKDNDGKKQGFEVTENENENPVNQFTIEEAVDLLEKLEDNHQDLIKTFLYENIYHNQDDLHIDATPDIEPLLSCPLLEWSALSAEKISLRFSEKFKNRRRSVYSYLLRKYDWDYYWNEDMHELKYPHGARLGDFSIMFIVGLNQENPEQNLNVQNNYSNKYYFPNDKITKLLDLYGCNRCKDGFVPIKCDEHF